MQFEWDDNKNKQNIQKHKLSFEEAARVFLDPNLLICPDPDTCEERWNAIGFVEKVLFVVYTEREGDVIRLISARKAMAIKNMTLDEVKNLPKLSKERIEELNTFEDTDFSDSPKKNAQQISNMKPARLVHPEWYKVKKKIFI